MGRARTGALATPEPKRAAAEESSALEAARRPSRGPAAATMDIPPLAGKIAALSLGALPLSYALNHVSALSQCVRGGARPAQGRGAGLRGRVGSGWEGRSAGGKSGCSEPGTPAQLPPGGRDLGRNYPSPMQPEVPSLPASGLCCGGGVAPGTFRI